MFDLDALRNAANTLADQHPNRVIHVSEIGVLIDSVKDDTGVPSEIDGVPVRVVDGWSGRDAAFGINVWCDCDGNQIMGVRGIGYAHDEFWKWFRARGFMQRGFWGYEHDDMPWSYFGKPTDPSALTRVLHAWRHAVSYIDEEVIR